MKKQVTTIIIPSFNGLPLLQRFLPSVITMARATDEIIVVDDASTDGTVGWLQHAHSLVECLLPSSLAVAATYYSGSKKEGKPQISLLSLHRNVRFAQAVNQAALLAQGEFLFLLNNDVEPEKSALKNLLQHFSDPTVFAVGALEYPSRQEKNTPSGRNILWFDEGVFKHSAYPKEDQYVFGETAWVSGGSGVFSTEKWRVLGGFDPSFYPAYWEDVDLSYRARQNGWKVLFEPSAVVYHHHETTNDATFGAQKIQKTSWKNGDYFTLKHASFLQKILFFLWRPVWYWRRFWAANFNTVA